MDIKAIKSKITAFIQKYKFVLLILLIGLVLIMLPSKKNTAQEVINTEQVQQEESLNEKLAEILSQIEGAGDVRVLLTVAAGEEIRYQADENITINADSSTTQVDTLIVTSADKSQVGLIRQINPPTYLGAIVVCQGADRPAIQLAIVDAVSKVTGLSSNKISVLKMK